MFLRRSACDAGIQTNRYQAVINHDSSSGCRSVDQNSRLSSFGNEELEVVTPAVQLAAESVGWTLIKHPASGLSVLVQGGPYLSLSPNITGGPKGTDLRKEFNSGLSGPTIQNIHSSSYGPFTKPHNLDDAVRQASPGISAQSLQPNRAISVANLVSVV